MKVETTPVHPNSALINIKQNSALSYVINPNKVGLVITVLIGGWHVVWALLVLLGWAQPIIDFIFWTHMIRPIYVIKTFDPIAALTLVVIASAMGYVFGYVGAIIWNRVHRQIMKKPNIRKILVPIDFSKLSRPAIETAKGLARKFGATVHLAHVREFYYPAGFMAPGGQVSLPLITYHDNSVTRLSRDLKAVAKRYDVPAENCQVVSGASTFHEICDLARTLSFDLIVVPTHGYTGIDHFFEGSTAERIVQHSPCPCWSHASEEEKRKRPTGVSIASSCR